MEDKQYLVLSGCSVYCDYCFKDCVTRAVQQKDMLIPKCCPYLNEHKKWIDYNSGPLTLEIYDKIAKEIEAHSLTVITLEKVITPNGEYCSNKCEDDNVVWAENNEAVCTVFNKWLDIDRQNHRQLFRCKECLERVNSGRKA